MTSDDAQPAVSSVRIPQHVAVIMDGNGRWAQQRNLPRLKGHEEGARSVLAVMEAARKAGVKYLTLYAFSTENWKRPESEVGGLMKLLGYFLELHSRDLLKNKIRLRIIGQIERLPADLLKKLNALIEKSAENYEQTLIVALSYGSRMEITDAAREIARKAARGEFDPEQITEETVARHLYLPDVPDPDLLIRTSGELRLSNFLLWQLSYSEIYVTEVLWPDFREKDFMLALEAFGRRGRRFGGIKTKQGTNG